jgi:hypothetical protein
MLPDRSRRSPTRYNSAVYASLVTNDYDVFLVSQAFLNGTEDANCVGPESASYLDIPSNVGSSFEHLSSMLRNGSLERLERTQCIKEYAKIVQPTRRNLLLVAANVDDDPNMNTTTGLPYGRPCINGVKNSTGVFWIAYFNAERALSSTYAEDSYKWLCSGSELDMSAYCAHEAESIRKASRWEVSQISAATYPSDGFFAFGDMQYWRWTVDHCLSESVTARCELHISTVITVIVTILNFCMSPAL